MRGVLTGDSLLEEEKRIRRRVKKGDIMLCVIVDTEKGKNILSLLKDKIRSKYAENAGKFSAPLEFRDLDGLGEYGDPLTFKQRERQGVCIISDVGANPEWFEDLTREAVEELEKEGIAGLGGATFYRPVFSVFGR